MKSGGGNLGDPTLRRENAAEKESDGEGSEIMGRRAFASQQSTHLARKSKTIWYLNCFLSLVLPVTLIPFTKGSTEIP